MAPMQSRAAKYFQEDPQDTLYHLGLDTTMDLASMFGDVEVVCMMGSAKRAEEFATRVASDVFGIAEAVKPLGKTERCSLFKTGKVISISHGMGTPSCSIFCHEVTKLLVHAGVDIGTVKFVRLGTSGGIGVAPGTVVIAKEAYDGTLTPGFRHVSLGREERFPAQADASLNAEIIKANESQGRDFPWVEGITVTADDYYHGQGRLDGAIPTWYGKDEKMEFMKKACDMGCVNFEMEGNGFLAFYQRLGCKAAVIAATLLNRMNGDQAEFPEKIPHFAERPQVMVIQWLLSLFPRVQPVEP